jgi:regulator of sirC expression with transglutaminase-like and TPR domain
MDAVTRFAAEVAAPSADVRLDIAALCIAACAHPGLDVDAACRELDALAAACPDPTFEGLSAYLFGTLAFRGNTDDYGDPENSFLDSVVARRTGIPITLSVLMMEVGRRVGVPVVGVGMPGHFLVQHGAASGVWCDPFHDGAQLDLDGCRALYRRVHGTTTGFAAESLAPASTHAILARMLNNLEHGRLATDPAQLAWMSRLHAALPGLAPEEARRVEQLQRAVKARWN